MTRGFVIRFALASLAVGSLGCPSHKEAAVPPETERKEGAAMAVLECSMSVAPTLRVGEPVELRFRLGNPTGQTLYVLEWQTPLEGFFGSYLRVTRDGTELPYVGPMVKRGEPEAEDYLAVEPGGALEATVEVSLPYDMRQPGRYRIEFQGQLLDVTPRKAAVPRPRAAHQALPVRCPAVETTLVGG